MPAIPVIDCVAVSSTDMDRTLAFYRCLGFTFPELKPDDQHIEAETPPGAVRLMIDTAALMTQLTGEAPRPANHSSFGLVCENPAAVDAAAKAVAEGGFTVVTEPWDAFWGQRYATVADPDGYHVDLFAEL